MLPVHHVGIIANVAQVFVQVVAKVVVQGLGLLPSAIISTYV